MVSTTDGQPERAWKSPAGEILPGTSTLTLFSPAPSEGQKPCLPLKYLKQNTHLKTLVNL